MRCVDVIQELAAPNGVDPAALAEHLASCPRCAAWAHQGARLERLWEATRPEEPSEATWAAVWAQATQTADSDGLVVAPAASTPRSFSLAAGRPSRRRALAAFAIAQAAVLLIAAWLVSRPGSDPTAQGPGRNGPELARRITGPATPESKATATVADGPEVVIDPGALVLIESGQRGMTVVSHAVDEGSNAVDANFVMFNMLEAMAE